MASCCPICYRVGIGNGEVQNLKNGKEKEPLKKEVELQERFFRLLQRYLNEDEEDTHKMGMKKQKIHFPLEELDGIGMLACEQCSKLMESFCELYHQLKSIELLINWKLGTLNNVMRHAQKVPSRMYHFQKFVGKLELDENRWSSLDDLIKSVTKTTKRLFMKCTRKTTNAFPKLSISKWQSLGEPSSGISSGPTHFDSQQHGNNFEGFCSEDNEVVNSSLIIGVEGLAVFNKSTVVADQPQLQQTCLVRANADSCNQDTWQTPTILKSLLTCDTNSSPEEIYQPTFPAPEILTGSKGDANNLVVKTASLQDDNYSFNGNDADDNDEPSSDNQSCWSVATETKPNIRENIKVPSILQSFFQRQGQDAQAMDSKNVGEMGPQSLPSPIYDETVVADDEDDYIDSDSMSWTSSASEGEVTDFKYSESDVKVAPAQILNSSSLWYEQMAARLRNQSYFRLKCPDCHGLFTSVQQLLVHRKDGDPCCANYDPAKSVKVEVMVPPPEKGTPSGNPKKQTLAREPQFTSRYAIVDLPQAMFICEIDNCGAIKYSVEDLETHKNLHGVFPCKFCNIEMDFAPDLAIHELQQHSKSVKVGTDKCPRCDFVFVTCGGNPYYVQHHLSGHLALTWHDSMCAICKTQSTKLPRDVHLHASHFKVQHDISSVPEKDVFNCQVENCNAYFLCSNQLDNHTRLCHKGDKSVDESSSLYLEEQMGSLESGSESGSVPFKKWHTTTFPHKSGLHCLFHTGSDTWRYSCDICSKKCPTKKLHKRHMRTHRKTMHVSVMEKVLEEMDSIMKVKEKRIPVVTELENELPNCEVDTSPRHKDVAGEVQNLSSSGPVVALSAETSQILSRPNSSTDLISQEREAKKKETSSKKALSSAAEGPSRNSSQGIMPKPGTHPKAPKEVESSLPVSDGNHSGTRDVRMLRSTSQCSHCKKTFSTSQRLQLHVETAHRDNQDVADDGMSSDDDNNFDVGNEDWIHNKNSLEPSSSSEDEQDTDDDFVAESNPLNLRIGDSLWYENIKRSVQKQSYYRLKCPDCSGLFNFGEDLLIHRKTSSPCLASYNPETSINVEVLLPADDAGTTKDVQFTTVHAVIRLPQAIFICDIENCGGVQYTLENLEAHKKLHGSFSCQFCDITAKFAPKLALHELQQHSKKLTGSKLLSCPRCDFKSEKRRSAFVRHHLGTHLSLFVNEPFCGICKTNKFNKENFVGKHVKHFKLLHDISNVTEEEIMRCPMEDCNAYFLHRLQLRCHLRLHHNTNLNRMVKKRKNGISRKKNLKWPEPPSKGEVYVPRSKKYKCKDCGKNYPAPNELNYHRVKHHVNPDKTIPCPFPKCNKVFETRQGMEAHKKFHSFEYFQTRMDPNRKRTYVQCHQCGKSVDGSNPTYLEAHIKSHERPKVARPYICEKCGKAFKDREKLRQHYLFHSGPATWEFMCSVCSKKCPTQQKLDEHMRTHTKEKPFICQVCGVKYAHRHNLRIHVNSKHGKQVEDKPRKFDKTNLTPKKGAKRKRISKVDLEESELTSGSSTDSE